ncbi:organic cation transporter protein-like [Aplysia californica]|uniref:Organic cation transporter protein-like n=1 Tax=Aplysia californica TaxID=6500 RepID=A0ABM1A4E4_APLCA|nr:organic cation transporter protein-like [Aplysia californica]
MPSDMEKDLCDDGDLKSFDDVLARIGHFGLFQKWILLVLVLIGLTVGGQTMCPVFTLSIPKHRCNIAELGNDTYAVQSASHQGVINRMIPLTDDGDYSSCYRYVTASSHNGTSTSRQKEKCDSWVYDKSVFQRTLTSDVTIEYMGSRHRAKVSLVMEMGFAWGQMLLTPIAYFEKDWQVFQFIILIPSILTVLTMWMVPESSRWLLARDRTEEAENTMQRAAKRNKVSLPSNVMSKIQMGRPSVSESPLNLFMDVQLALRWLVLYVNCGKPVSPMTFTLLLFCAIGWIVVALSLLGKMAISSASILMYTYTAELFPTKCRAFGLGSCSMVARIGGISSAYVADLNTYVHGQFGQVLPQLVFGAAGIVGALLTLILPETRNRKLPETIADAKNVIKDAADPNIVPDRSKMTDESALITKCSKTRMGS